MALAECAAPAVLPAKPHGSPFQHQAAERQRLRQRPIDVVGLERFPALLNRPGQLWVQVKIRWETRYALNDALEHGPLDGGRRMIGGNRRSRNRAQFLKLVLLLVLLCLIINLVEALLLAVLPGFDLRCRSHAFLLQAFGVALGYRLLLADLAIEYGLRVAWIVSLIVAVLAVAHHVDHDVLVKPLAIIVSELRGAHARFRIVA